MPELLQAGKPMPQFVLPLVGGGEVTVGQNLTEGRYTLFSFYRGLFCPLCKKYNAQLEENLADLDKLGVDVVFVSMGDQEEAEKAKKDWDMKSKVAYGLSESQARALGMYITDGQKFEMYTEPSVFAEPGMYMLNPAGTLQFVDVSNAPFLRPEISMVMMGLKFVMSSGYPTRGTRAA